jgi:hypothetical protein
LASLIDEKSDGRNQREIQGGEGKQASAQHQAASLASDIRVILCYLIVAFVINDIQQVSI